jgi:branched-chain amino acid transport system ATP-binding protein
MEFVEIQNLCMRFGPIRVLENINLKIKKKEIRGIIGPNGAGKTTLINLICGVYKPTAGNIYLDGKRISGREAYEISKMGVGRTFQIPRIFSDMTVMDNVITAGLEIYENENKLKTRSIELLKLMKIDHLRNEPAKNLSGGQKKLLEVARALIRNPKLLLLDEPFHGVHPRLNREIIENLTNFKKTGMTIVLVSHDLPTIFDTCDKITVLSAGTVISEGTPEEVRTDEKVIEAYIGV